MTNPFTSFAVLLPNDVILFRFTSIVSGIYMVLEKAEQQLTNCWALRNGNDDACGIVDVGVIVKNYIANGFIWCEWLRLYMVLLDPLILGGNECCTILFYFLFSIQLFSCFGNCFYMTVQWIMKTRQTWNCDNQWERCLTMVKLRHIYGMSKSKMFCTVGK